MKQNNETDDSMRDYHVSFSYYAHRNQRLIVSFLLYVLSEVPFREYIKFKGKKDEMSGKRYLSQCNEENLLQKYLFYF
jgi:hypothetical protein